MSPQGLFLRLLLAAGLGAAIGLEREIRQKPAGLRTNILIAVGAALFSIVSLRISGGSLDRIAAPIVTGVGFLGAGAIMRGPNNIQRLTTAATTWANTANDLPAGLSEAG